MRTFGGRCIVAAALVCGGLAAVTGVAVSPAGAVTSDLISVVSAQQTLAATTALRVNLDCPSGYDAVSGGLDSSEGNHTDIIPIESSPESAAHVEPAGLTTIGAQPSWALIVWNPDSMSHFFTGEVTCAPVSGGVLGPLTVVSGAVLTQPAGSTTRATTTCPAADQAVGGGWVTGAWSGSAAPFIAASSPEIGGVPMRSLANGPNASATGWDTQRVQPTGAGSTFDGVAVCANQTGLSNTSVQVTLATIAATTAETFSANCPAGTESVAPGVDTGSVPQVQTFAQVFGATGTSAEAAGTVTAEATGMDDNIDNLSGGTIPFADGAVCIAAPVAPPPPVKTVTRLSGVDRVGTAIAISLNSFPTSGSAHVVVLARSDVFADALAGGPLAVAKHGPVLLTDPTAMDPRTLAEIQRVLPTGGTVYVLGGVDALSPAIDSALAGAGYAELREAGVDRFDTAVKIAEAIGSVTKVLEATGLDFPDALSAGAAAGHIGAAVVLTDGTVQASETATYLAANPSLVRYAIGGEAAAADPSAHPVAGADRFATAVAVATTFFTAPTIVAAALGTNFPDALAGGANAGAKGAPLVLVEPSAPLPAPTDSYLVSVKASVTGAFLYGGPSAVGDDVLTAIQTAIT